MTPSDRSWPTTRARLGFGLELARLQTEVLDPAELDGIPVFAADEVRAFFHELPVGTKTHEVVTTVAPPFERFFVEFQRVENPLGFNAWGVLVDQVARYDEPQGDTGWQIFLRLIVERPKKTPRSGP